MNKFELTSEFITDIFGNKMFRIKALINFGNVKEGELGGYIEKEENLSQEDNAWVYGDARVCGDADYATIKGFGTSFRNTTFFKCRDDKVHVVCGCFYGTLEEFRKQVKQTREGKIANEYLMIADLMQYHFDEEQVKKEKIEVEKDE